MRRANIERMETARRLPRWAAGRQQTGQGKAAAADRLCRPAASQPRLHNFDRRAAGRVLRGDHPVQFRDPAFCAITLRRDGMGQFPHRWRLPAGETACNWRLMLAEGPATITVMQQSAFVERSGFRRTLQRDGCCRRDCCNE